MTYKGYISGFTDGVKEERRRIIDILLDNTNFTWIDQEGTNLISEIIGKISVNKEKQFKKTTNWIVNYWKTLKQQGMTEKQLIVRFNSYLENLEEGLNPSQTK